MLLSVLFPTWKHLQAAEQPTHAKARQSTCVFRGIKRGVFVLGVFKGSSSQEIQRDFWALANQPQVDNTTSVSNIPHLGRGSEVWKSYSLRKWKQMQKIWRSIKKVYFTSVFFQLVHRAVQGVSRLCWGDELEHRNQAVITHQHPLHVELQHWYFKHSNLSSGRQPPPHLGFRC